MKNDTTDNGVSDKPDNQGKSDRENSMNEIAANARIARELEEAGVDTANPMEVKLAKEKIDRGESPDPHAGPDPDTGEPIISADDAIIEDEMITVIVNGTEKSVKKADVDAEGGVVAYQKMRAADERLRLNAERARELDQRELAIAQQEQALLTNTDHLSNNDDDLSDVAEGITSKMYSGDEELAKEGVKTILERAKNSTPNIDTDAMAADITAKVQQEIEWNSAKSNFAKNYPDINGNTEYFGYADSLTNEIQSLHPTWPVGDIMNEAGKQAREHFKDALTNQKKISEDEQRMQNKRTTDNVSVTNARVTSKPAQKPMTQSQIIANMQSNRSHAAN